MQGDKWSSLLRNVLKYFALVALLVASVSLTQKRSAKDKRSSLLPKVFSYAINNLTRSLGAFVPFEVRNSLA